LYPSPRNQAKNNSQNILPGASMPNNWVVKGIKKVKILGMVLSFLIIDIKSEIEYNIRPKPLTKFTEII